MIRFEPAIGFQRVIETNGQYWVEVTINDMLEVKLPPLCASCCRPADGAYLAQGGEELEIKLEIPNCTTCFERESAAIRRRSWRLTALGAPLAVLGLPPILGWTHDLPALNFFALSGGALLVSGVLGVVGLAIWLLGTQGLLMGISSEGSVQISTVKGGTYGLLFENAKYGMMFVAANGGPPPSSLNVEVNTEDTIGVRRAAVEWLRLRLTHPGAELVPIILGLLCSLLFLGAFIAALIQGELHAGRFFGLGFSSMLLVIGSHYLARGIEQKIRGIVVDDMDGAITDRYHSPHGSVSMKHVKTWWGKIIMGAGIGAAGLSIFFDCFIS